ncbi:unnamed protein product, partial [Discosporangium mesarthrocarpum]
AVLGSDHPQVATGLNNQVGLLKRQVRIRLNNLAALFESQGKYISAEPLHRGSLVIRREILGPDHPDVAESLNNLAGLLATQDKYDPAEHLYRKIMEIIQRSLDSEHLNATATLINPVAMLTAQVENI